MDRRETLGRFPKSKHHYKYNATNNNNRILLSKNPSEKAKEMFSCGNSESHNRGISVHTSGLFNNK